MGDCSPDGSWLRLSNMIVFNSWTAGIVRIQVKARSNKNLILSVSVLFHFWYFYDKHDICEAARIDGQEGNVSVWSSDLSLKKHF